MGCLKSKPAKEHVRDTYELYEIKDDRDITKPLNDPVFKNREWELENLVVEGGSTNGTVTVGSYKVLEFIGVTSRLKRFAGS